MHISAGYSYFLIVIGIILCYNPAMSYECKELTMGDGNVNAFHCWLPEGGVQSLVLLSHGMTEYAFRYAPFGEFLNSRGIALFAEDHRGHGKTAERAEREGTGSFGYLADKDGFFRVVDDIMEEARMLRGQYPGKKLFLFGHSFGSFIAQCFIERYGQLVDGCILCGSAGPRLSVYPGSLIIKAITAFSGKKNISPLIGKLTMGSYGDNWLSRDTGLLAKYVSDPWCTFKCKNGFYVDMLSGLCYIHRKKSLAAIPKSLPVFLIAGTDDPVGDYGKSVRALYGCYRKLPLADVTLKLYEGAKHELLNEINRAEVMNDVLAWMNRR